MMMTDFAVSSGHLDDLYVDKSDMIIDDDESDSEVVDLDISDAIRKLSVSDIKSELESRSVASH